MRDRWTLSSAGGKHGVGVGVVNGLRRAQKAGTRLRIALWMFSNNWVQRGEKTLAGWGGDGVKMWRWQGL